MMSGRRITFEAGSVIASTSIQSFERTKNRQESSRKIIGNDSVYSVPRKSQWFGIWAGASAGTHGN